VDNSVLNVYVTCMHLQPCLKQDVRKLVIFSAETIYTSHYSKNIKDYTHISLFLHILLGLI